MARKANITEIIQAGRAVVSAKNAYIEALKSGDGTHQRYHDHMLNCIDNLEYAVTKGREKIND